MKKQKALTQHLIDVSYQGRKIAKPEQFDNWIEDCKIEPSSKKINTGIVAARFYYSGVISINPCAAPVEMISVFVSFWMQNNAEKHDNETVELSSDRITDKTSDIEIVIEQLVEDIELIESINGPFELNDKRYDFGENSLWVAETFTLQGEIKNDC